MASEGADDGAGESGHQDTSGDRRRREARRAWTRQDFPVLIPMPTRWADNDMFGHLNNAVYYELFDTAINGWLATAVGRDAATTPELGVVAESGCVFYREVGFPEPLTVGIRVERLGRSSVTYAVGVFGGRGEASVAAVGHWVHVYVDRVTRRAMPMPDAVRTALQGIMAGDSAVDVEES